ncbi:hypothetical protein NP493_332g03040 [Ridgeia piscesae]|uniref:Uncharacterized protein n=1 Tax=Ridgeia piscesae TaxID=27915 RepID=A0AAD9NVS2_RIDPI|nr:hypothetical protein NP493_332g03040 [Ridgeia piscesae]
MQFNPATGTHCSLLYYTARKSVTFLIAQYPPCLPDALLHAPFNELVVSYTLTVTGIHNCSQSTCLYICQLETRYWSIVWALPERCIFLQLHVYMNQRNMQTVNCDLCAVF